jgi:putative endonuclease
MASPKGVAIQASRAIHMKQPAIYIMANFRNGTLYVGVTSDLIKRAYEHREGLTEGFIKTYACKQLVYYEQHATMHAALEREQQIKSGSRKKKLALIERLNPHWQDLFGELS